jgi:AGZA family xanthine/uracil permease-like MFS transporter
MKAFVKGDLDGFFALALDNLINLLLIASFCLGVLKFSPDVFYGHVLPAAAVSLIIGNVFYAWQARALARRENRTDVCALPYGLCLFTVLAFSLFVMLPAQQAALARGLAKPAADLEAWRAGIAACLASGFIELFGGLWIDRVRHHIPRAALLATPGMVGLLFISADFFFRCTAYPDIGFVTLGLICAIYYGRMKLKGGLPASLVVVVAGTAIAWLWHREGPLALVPVGTLASDQVGLRLPVPVIGDLIASLPLILPYLPVTIPMGLLGLVNSLQCLESAEAAGDKFAGRPAMVMNGLGTIAAASFGSPYPTTLYYGHPGWKAIGARAGYSTLNAVFFTVVLLTGTFSYIAYAVPVEAGMAILVWIGATMFMQAFSSVPVKHYPAVAIGMLPPVAGFAALLFRHALAGAGLVFSPELLTKISTSRNYALGGVFASDSGYIFMSILWSGAVVAMVERKFRHAAGWMLGAAVFSAAGFMHATKVTPFDVIGSVAPAWPWVWAYLATAVLLMVMPWIAQPTDEPMP